MIRGIITLFACVVGLVASAGQVHAGVMVDFELGAPTVFNNQVPLTNEFAGLGVNFTGQGEVLNMSSFTIGSNSGTDALAFNSSVLIAGPELAVFDFDIQSVSLFVAVGGGATPVTVRAFDVSNTLLGLTTQSVGSTYSQLSLSGIGNIRSISVNTNATVWAIDDLEFQAGANAVPEPASLAMFGFAAVGLVAGGVRRRRKRQA